MRGRLAVFGERAEAGYDTRAERAARAPYLAACLVGRASAAGPIEVLSAYAHPCAAAAHLMLLDSAMERRTLAQLRSLQVWLGSRKGVLVGIEKPMFDLSPGGEGDPERAPTPPCLPDFVVRASRAGDEREATIIVETMGFADERYRTRKDRTHAVMHAVLDGAPIVVHDFHQPPGRSQEWRNDRFWRDLRWALTGPEPRRDVRRGAAVASAGETTAAARVARRSEPPRASGSPARSSAPAAGR